MARQVRKEKQTSEAHGGKRLEIIQHCANLFDKVGYHGTTMQMLADEVGLGKPTLYHYFRSKAEILYAIHELHIDALLAGLEEFGRKDLHPSELLRNACTDILRQIAQHPGYVRAFMDHYSELEGDMRKNIRMRRNQYLAGISSVLERGVAEGSFEPCDIELTAFGFLGMCNWAYKWYPAMHKKRSPESVSKSLCDVFLKGLERSPA
ncbi:MAG TPA: TetR/AcrR family transcriptional regulator [Sphingobium sp.]|nr:TetR/AcrR family transcriptional regulator [Sphingobium sp.]